MTIIPIGSDPAGWQGTVMAGWPVTSNGAVLITISKARAITAYSGVDTAQPVDAVDAMMNGSGTAVTAPSIITTVANTMLVQLVTVKAATGPTGNRVATASLPGAGVGVLLALRPAG